MQTMIAVLLNAIMIIRYHYSLLILVLLLAVLMILAPKILQRKLERSSDEYSQANEHLTEQVTDVFAGYNALYILRLKNLIRRKVKQSSENFGQKKVAFMTVKGENSGVINEVSLISQTAVVVLAGWLALRGYMKVGSIITCSSLAGIIFGNLTAMSFDLVGVRSTKPILKKYQDLVISDDSPAKQQLSTFNQQIQLKNISYQYRGASQPVLTNFNLNFVKNKNMPLLHPRVVVKLPY